MVKQMAEKRGLTTSTVNLKESEDGVKTLTGYAVEWGKRSHLIGGEFREEVARGAFTESLKNGDQRALWSHDTSKVLGRTKNGTLRLDEDERGLYFEIDLPNTTLGADTYESVKRGDVDGVSFGFIVKRQSWFDGEATIIRTIEEAELLEVSPIAFPAYPDSTVDARGIEPYLQHKEEKNMQEIEKLILEMYL